MCIYLALFSSSLCLNSLPLKWIVCIFLTAFLLWLGWQILFKIFRYFLDSLYFPYILSSHIKYLTIKFSILELDLKKAFWIMPIFTFPHRWLDSQLWLADSLPLLEDSFIFYFLLGTDNKALSLRVWHLRLLLQKKGRVVAMLSPHFL